MPPKPSPVLVLALAMFALPSAARAQKPTVPTIVITVHEMAAIDSSSPASFALQNAGSAVKADSDGDVDIYAATEIRFAFATAEYVPVGITFEQTSGTTDRAGTRNFPTRTIANGTLTVNAANLDNDEFEYSIIYRRTSDGALGLIDPRVINHPRN